MGSGTETTALVVALVALVIALLQVIHQYVSSALARGKVNRAAIGLWAKRNKYSWSIREWNLRVEYGRPVCSATEVVKRVAQRGHLRRKAAEVLQDFHLSWDTTIADGPRGPRVPKSGELVVTRNGDEMQTPICHTSLTRRQRAAVEEFEEALTNAHKRVPPCKASWCNLVADLGSDILDLPCRDYVDADTIANALDAPTVYIQMSDLICFGFFLDMEISRFEVWNRCIDMIGKHCNITTQHQQGVGMLTRYSGLAPTVQPAALRCTAPELDTLLDTTHGRLQIGNAWADMDHWGYNTVDLIFTTAFSRASGELWEQIRVNDVMQGMGPDSDIRWLGKWSQPLVPVVPSLLCLCSNMAVANAFPLRYISPWTNDQRTVASQRAFSHIQQNVDFTEAPTTLFKSIRAQGLDLIVMDDFKTANNWGCEYGGLRGWLVTNFAEFTLRMSKCWVVTSMMHQVPLLPHLRHVLLEGRLNVAWARNYNSNIGNNDQGDGWKMKANSLLWFQIMMFDSWIARRVELIMGGSASCSASIPVDVDAAKRCSSMEENHVEVTAWKRSRLAFTRHYLAKLADGVEGKGVSCMSPGEKHDPVGGWSDMPVGNASDWANVDAVLTLRAVVLTVRLELMKDSSALLDLEHLDPMVQMA